MQNDADGGENEPGDVCRWKIPVEIKFMQGEYTSPERKVCEHYQQEQKLLPIP